MVWKPGTYYMYIMASNAGATYVGMTNNLMRRVQEHRDEGEEGYCGKWYIEKLVYFEEYSSPRDAIEREKQLKKWKREKKIALISESNPKWEDMTHLLSL